MLKSSMPELPEVETTIRYLKQELLDDVVEDIRTTTLGKSHFNLPFEEVKERLKKKKLTELSRVGKWMLFEFEDTKVVAHLRMSGRYLVADTPLEHAHNRFQLLFSTKVANYIDLRRFGTFHFVDSFENHSGLKSLGPDALGETFHVQHLFNALQKTKKPIYTALLDQNIVAGLGNIYVNEVLNAVSVHPLTISNTVSREKAAQIVVEAKRILNLALDFKGTTLIDNLYQDPEGNSGGFAKMLKVYGKKKDPNINVIKVGGRSVFYRKELDGTRI